jgi:hypothetical protein
VESYRLYERTQFEGNDVAGLNWETMNTFRGVAIDVTYPMKLLVLPNEGAHATTVDY